VRDRERDRDREREKIAKQKYLLYTRVCYKCSLQFLRF
jgi:hypothetical protein